MYEPADANPRFSSFLPRFRISGVIPSAFPIVILLEGGGRKRREQVTAPDRD